MNFILIQDEETANKLRSLKYEELPKNGNFFVFVNKVGKCEFSDNKKIVYTNILSF